MDNLVLCVHILGDSVNLHIVHIVTEVYNEFCLLITTLVLSTNFVKMNGIHWRTGLFCPLVGHFYNYEL